MKSLLIIVTALISLSAIAQKKNISINHTINDDGKTLSIKIKGTINEKPVNYTSTFDVAGMTGKQKDAIKRHVYDSLGLPDPTVPRAPLTRMTAISSVTMTEPTAPREPSTLAQPVIASKSQFEEFYIIGGDHPYTKEIKYNPKTGVLYMKYRFIKNGEETAAEKTIDAKDRSKEERDWLIKKYEREIGVAQPEII